MHGPESASGPLALPEDARKALGAIIRHTIEQGLKGINVASADARTGSTDDAPQPAGTGAPAGAAAADIPVLREPLGAFVTLHLDGHLRGCIGSILGRDALWRTVTRMAFAAAFEDPRFPPLARREWPRVTLECSVLGPLTRCPDPEAVQIGRHGLVLVARGRSGVFLPQVPVEQGWDRLTYLDQLCRKAGLPPGVWKEAGAELHWFEAVVFPC